MGFCSKRHLFLTLCIIQMLVVVQRQVFDFLGFLWIPILVNFIEVIFIIFGFFGAYQYRPKYLLSNVFWQLFWLGWNVFIVCLYLDVGELDHKTHFVLKLDTDSESWWIKRCPECNYVHVEVFQGGLQCLLAIFNIIIGLCLCRAFMEEDDSSSHKSRKNAKRMSLYSIEFSAQPDRPPDPPPAPLSPKPMTPRRVKRRSVLTRGPSGRRSSRRASRRRANPVTRLLDQQLEPAGADSPPLYAGWRDGHSNPTYQQSSAQSLREAEEFEELYGARPPSARSGYSNFHGARTVGYARHCHSLATPQVPQKRAHRSSMRSMAFLNNGPPAYTTAPHQQAAIDSETTI